MAAALAQTAMAADTPINETNWKPDYCVTTQPPANSTSIPRKFGLVLFQGVDTLDVFGFLEPLWRVSRQYHLELYLIAETLDPISAKPRLPSMNPFNSSWFPEVLPTHTFATAPQDLDIVVVPGGGGTRNPAFTQPIDFIAQTYPKLKYFLTICTGAIFAAKAGVFDGKRATSNKLAWQTVTNSSDKVHWVGHARWVVDGTTWSTSGVSAGIDGTLAFIECIYGPDLATSAANGMEYIRHPDPSFDPFADLYNITTTWQ